MKADEWTSDGSYSHESEVMPMIQVSKSSRKEDGFLDWCGLLIAFFNLLTEGMKLYRIWKAQQYIPKHQKKKNQRH